MKARRVYLPVAGQPHRTVCPATICPLFAPDGSPWTGDKNSPCARHEASEPDDPLGRHGCIFWDDKRGCDGAGFADAQIDEVRTRGGTLQGPVAATRGTLKPEPTALLALSGAFGVPGVGY